MFQCFGNEECLEEAHESDFEHAEETSIPPEDEVYGEEVNGGKATRGKYADEDDVFVDFSFFQDYKDRKKTNTSAP